MLEKQCDLLSEQELSDVSKLGETRGRSASGDRLPS